MGRRILTGEDEGGSDSESGGSSPGGSGLLSYHGHDKNALRSS